MRTLKRFAYIIYLGLVCSVFVPVASAVVKSAPPHIIFHNFTGIYHLSRDRSGVSLLTTEETIVADFPSQGNFYGITRAIPKSYQGHTVNIKILNILDVAGNPVPYKATDDTKDNLVISTGDPTITLYGSQTIKITYQTSDVVQVGQEADNFLLNVNGRGWDQAFSRVDATLYVPDSFSANLKGQPTCYTSLTSPSPGDCSIHTQKQSHATVVTSKAELLPAHQALVLKLNFAPATFKHKQNALPRILLAAAGVILLVGGAKLAYKRLGARRKPSKVNSGPKS